MIVVVVVVDDFWEGKIEVNKEDIICCDSKELTTR